jgi:hypothetical protein
MIKVIDFEEQISTLLPVTHALLKSANLTVHNNVTRITLHGSRGLAGCYRSDSDLDLSLIVDIGQYMGQTDLDAFLEEVWETTVSHWQGDVIPDLAIVFDAKNCGLTCFDVMAFDPESCPRGGMNCFGLYKKQDGFDGLVTDPEVKVQLMYPCITIWKKK